MIISGLAIDVHADTNIQGQTAHNSAAKANVMKIVDSSNLTIQEIKPFEQFMMYSISNYGMHSGKLNQLEYVADLNFAYWYIGNFTHIPASNRTLSKQNANVIIPMWENESPQARNDIQAVANYEVNQHMAQNEINTTYVVNNHLGKLVSNKTIMYNNQTANIITYRYTKDNQTLVYGLIDQKGLYTPVDPYIRLNAFTIHWGWGGIISGTSYNIYFTFDNYNTAKTWENFLETAATIDQWATVMETAVFWIAVGIASGPFAPIVAIVGTVEALLAQDNPLSAAHNVRDIFDNQEYYKGQYTMAYTLNAWEWGLVPEFSWWGWEYNDPSPGKTALVQVFKNVGFDSNAETNFESTYNYLTNKYGTNTEHYFPAPPTWLAIEIQLQGDM